MHLLNISALKLRLALNDYVSVSLPLNDTLYFFFITLSRQMTAFVFLVKRKLSQKVLLDYYDITCSLFTVGGVFCHSVLEIIDYHSNPQY